MDRTDAELQRQLPTDGIKDGSNDGYIRNVLYSEHFGGNELCGEFRTTVVSEQAIEVRDALVRVKEPFAQGEAQMLNYPLPGGLKAIHYSESVKEIVHG